MKRKILPYNHNLKPIANQLRKQMTLSEVLLWNELKQKKMLGMDFDRQRPVLNYIVDFYCKDLMLAIEIDGSSHDQKWEDDKKRQCELQEAGVRFLRFADQDVKKDLQSILRAIQYWIEDTISKEGFIGRITHP